MIVGFKVIAFNQKAFLCLHGPTNILVQEVLIEPLITTPVVSFIRNYPISTCMK